MYKIVSRGVCIFVFSLSLLLNATVFKKTAFEKMVKDSDVIIKGKCIEVMSKIVPEVKDIMSVATIEVKKTLKGSLKENDKIQVIYLGGAIEKPLPLTTKVIGGVNLKKNDEFYLFLKNIKKNTMHDKGAQYLAKNNYKKFRVYSLGKGVFRIKKGKVLFAPYQKYIKKNFMMKKGLVKSKKEFTRTLIEKIKFSDKDFEDFINSVQNSKNVKGK